MILFLIFGALIGMTLVEFYVVIKVGEAIGVLPTLGLMVLDAMIGAMLMRSQGRSVWGRLRDALAAGRPPAREVLDGALVVAGGAFLITPGFVTDIFGALLLIPPTRAVVRRWVVRRFTGRLLGPVAGGWVRRRAAAGRASQQPAGSAGWQPPPYRPPTGRPAPAPRYDVEGQAIELDAEELER